MKKSTRVTAAEERRPASEEEADPFDVSLPRPGRRSQVRFNRGWGGLEMRVPRWTRFWPDKGEVKNKTKKHQAPYVLADDASVVLRLHGAPSWKRHVEVDHGRDSPD